MAIMSKQTITWSVGSPLPAYANKTTVAAIISHLVFLISRRTIENWPLIARRPNRENVYNVEDALSLAKAKLEQSPSYKQAAAK